MKIHSLPLVLILIFVEYGCMPEAPSPSKDSDTVTIDEPKNYLDENPVYDTPFTGDPTQKSLHPARQSHPDSKHYF